MRRLLVALLLALSVALILPPSAAGAARASSSSTVVSEPNVIVGTLSYSAGGGYRVTVGFVPCGHEYPWTDEAGNPIVVHDTLAQYYAKVRKGGGWTTEVWAHSPGRLDEAITGLYGFGLSAEAIATLNEDASIYSCSG